MTQAVRPMTTVDLVRSEGWRYGFDLSEDEAGHILWEFTGWPGFWPPGFKRLVDVLRYQLDRYFELRQLGFIPCARCGDRSLDYMCPLCDAQMR